jgi:hypothetical protein
MWIFPPPSAVGGPPRAATRFFANNVAFRRETALAFPFPDVRGSDRGACAVLARRLVDAGIVPLMTPAAAVSHPAPDGVRRAVARALVEGRDYVRVGDALPGDEGIGAVRGGWSRIRSVVTNRRAVGLRVYELPPALAIAGLYHGLMAAGAALARVAPETARRLSL